MRFPTSGISFLLYSIMPHRSNTMVAHNPVMTSINQHSAFHPFFPGSSRMFPADPSHALIAAGSLPPAFFSRPPQDLVAAFPPSPVLFHPGLPAFLHTAPFHPHLPKHVRGSNLEERLADNGPKKCHLCEKSYSRMSTLRLHMRAHSGEKPYQCLVCLKSFSQAANLTAHFRIHSGEKPFKCRVCDRRFSQSPRTCARTTASVLTSARFVARPSRTAPRWPSTRGRTRGRSRISAIFASSGSRSQGIWTVTSEFMMLETKFETVQH